MFPVKQRFSERNVEEGKNGLGLSVCLNTTDDRRSLQITADHLNMTADHLCLICLNTADHRR